MTSNQSQPPPLPRVAGGSPLSRTRTALGRSTNSIPQRRRISLAPTGISSLFSSMMSTTTTTNEMDNRLSVSGLRTPITPINPSPDTSTTPALTSGGFPTRYGRATILTAAPPKFVAIVETPDVVVGVGAVDPRRRRVVTTTSFSSSYYY